MFYRLRRDYNVARLNRGIAGILQTSPLVLRDAPWCIASMVADRDVPMYLIAIKAFYPKIGRGKVAVIIDRAMPQALRDTLSHHVPGIEFVILEDIPTDPCQRGGTWERLLYCLDRSETEFTMQLDADMLAVGADLSEVVACLEQNRAFTMSDGFALDTLVGVAEMARATPSDYIGIASEARMDGLPGATTRRYIRGSSGFAGFARGGYSRAEISAFHQDMEALVGRQRWREWGSEQCGSNFAIANSPDPLILPYPAYGSFTRRVLRHEVKLFHFIGRFRFVEGYYQRRASEVIAALTPGAAKLAPPPAVPTVRDGGGLPMALARSLVPASLPAYLLWRLGGRRAALAVQLRARTEFQTTPGPGPRLTLRAGRDGAADDREADEVFARLHCLPPVWIPGERVLLVVDLGAGVGISCLWWLSNYWRTRVVAFEPDAACAASLLAQVALNGWQDRLTLRPEPAAAMQAGEVLDGLQGSRVDILRIDLPGQEAALLDDPRFAALDVGAVLVAWHAQGSASAASTRDACIARLEAAGFAVHVTSEADGRGTLWGFRRPAR